MMFENESPQVADQIRKTAEGKWFAVCGTCGVTTERFTAVAAANWLEVVHKCAPSDPWTLEEEQIVEKWRAYETSPTKYYPYLHVPPEDLEVILSVLDRTRAALKSVQSLHRPLTLQTTGRTVCMHCVDADESSVAWPCPTALALTDGEEEDE